MSSKVNKSVLDDTFEVHSVRLPNGCIKYESIRALTYKLNSFNMSAEDAYAASCCINVLAYRLDAYRQPRVDAELEYQSWFEDKK